MICIGGIIIGRYGGPYVVLTEPSTPVNRPTPNVGHARSFMTRGF